MSPWKEVKFTREYLGWAEGEEEDGPRVPDSVQRLIGIALLYFNFLHCSLFFYTLQGMQVWIINQP